MSSNKPNVQRYADMGAEQICPVNNMYGSDDGDYVLYEDYKALQDKYNSLVQYYKNGIECFANPCEKHSGENAPSFSEFFEEYGGQCLICVVDNNKTLQAENEKLPTFSVGTDLSDGKLTVVVLKHENGVSCVIHSEAIQLAEQPNAKEVTEYTQANISLNREEVELIQLALECLYSELPEYESAMRKLEAMRATAICREGDEE